MIQESNEALKRQMHELMIQGKFDPKLGISDAAGNIQITLGEPIQLQADSLTNQGTLDSLSLGDIPDFKLLETTCQILKNQILARDELVIGYLGPEGTFTDQAVDMFAAKLRAGKHTKMPIKTLDDVFEYLLTEQITAATVPLTNNIVGDYTKTIEGLKNQRVQVVERLQLQIILCLGIHPNANPKNIAEIRSYETALGQASMYLDHQFPTARRIGVDSTADAMRKITTENLLDVGAIGSEYGINIYNLQLVSKGIENRESFTDFVYLTRKW